jgi:YfiH family protein
MDSAERAYPSGDGGLGALPLLRSRVLGQVVHAFPTRAGGVSPAPYDSLNLAVRWGDGRDNVLENRRRLLAACGVERVAIARQVHGAGVVNVTAAELPPDTEADALISDVSGVALGVFTADCVPLLIADPVTGAVAAVHAGWRGVIAGVAPAAVQGLRGCYGSRPADLRVALGPAIGPCCFEVGAEVEAAFAASFPGLPLATPGPAGKPHIDLKRALRAQLQGAGIPAAQIDAGDECTRCEPARFFSYRRDNTRTGQHLSVIVVPPQTRGAG